MNKSIPTLWIVGGVLFMLPSLLGNDRAELVPIGIVFIIVGIATKKNSEKLSAREDQKL